MTHRRLFTGILALVLTVSPATAQSASRKVTLRNNLTAGAVTRQEISRVIRRTTKRPKYVETLTYSRQSAFVQCNVDESKPGYMKIYQMMADEPPQVLRVFHDSLRIEPVPSADDFNLIDGAASLHSAALTPYDAPFEALPATEPYERAVLAAIMDFAHWPRKQIESGHRWEHDVDVTGFSGTQTLEFVDLAKVDGQSAARITMYLQGQFTGALAGEFEFEKGQVLIYWSRFDRTALKIDGQAVFSRVRGRRREEFELKLEVKRTHQLLLTEDEQSANLKQLNAFATALTDFKAGENANAARACGDFESEWPASIWMPAVTALSRQAARANRPPPKLSNKQFQTLLLKSVIAWDAARENHDDDLLERTRRALIATARDYRDRLKKMLDGKDAGERARAVFVMAFGDRPADLGLVQRAARDASALVRAMALSGIAARGSADVDAAVLLAALKDEDDAVRRRACEAVASCVPREHRQIVAFVTAVTSLLKTDAAVIVRCAAAEAIGEIGAPADVPVLQQARTGEKNKQVRKAIDRAIERLKKRE